MNKQDILKQAAQHRELEVFNHQINIDNYRLAIAEVEKNHADKLHMVEFSARLKDLLKSSTQEQDKEKVMLKVILAQIEDIDGIAE